MCILFVQVFQWSQERLQGVGTESFHRDKRRCTEGPAVISWAPLTALSPGSRVSVAYERNSCLNIWRISSRQTFILDLESN